MRRHSPPTAHIPENSLTELTLIIVDISADVGSGNGDNAAFMAAGPLLLLRAKATALLPRLKPTGAGGVLASTVWGWAKQHAKQGPRPIGLPLCNIRIIGA